ncbi:MAG TPA: helix-turn-helix domain-containing protein [Solirubrobacteraceae bacterium]|nr:helix-turn-helix domain-containing protein [Solirubrobacteraceae bacterium]
MGGLRQRADYLTVNEIAELLRLNPQTIRNTIDCGELPAVRFGPRRVRVKQSDLDAFIAASTAAKQATKVEQYRVALSDRDAVAAPASSDPTPEVWVYEVEASSPDQAVARAIRQWHSEVDNDVTAHTITVSLVER